MSSGRLLAGTILAVLLLQATAAAMDCRRAATPAEHAICADPMLRAADAKMSETYAIVRGALWGKALKDQLAKSQRAWLALRDAGCATASCLGPRIGDRGVILEALAAQVSDSNPSIYDLHAVWLAGSWTVGPAEPKKLEAFGRLPEEGKRIFFRPGELCDGPGVCASFGLSVQKLSEGAGRQDLPAQLHLQPDALTYHVLYFGKAEYELVPMPDGTLLARSEGCAKSGKPCGDVSQVWRPLGPDSRVHEADLSKQ